MAERSQPRLKLVGVTRAPSPGERASPALPPDLEAICRKRGGRLTRQRWAALRTLIGAQRPLTAYELLDLLKPRDHSATPASTYRSLEFLVGVGLVHRLETTRSYIACGRPDHLHSVQFLICRNCGTVIEAEDRRLSRAADALGERHGFALDQRTVELTGVCATCKVGRAAGPNP
jgi:Fur family transcriptional regulator, zinc uptake regulator